MAHEFWLRARFVQTESKALSKSLFCRIFLRSTGAHLSEMSPIKIILL